MWPGGRLFSQDRKETGSASGQRMEPRRGGLIQGQVKSQGGGEQHFTRLADVAMATAPGRDVIMPCLIRIWQAGISPTTHLVPSFP